MYSLSYTYVMVKLKGEITDPPDLDTSDAAGTAKDWAGYALVIGMAFAVIGVARTSIQPMIEQTLANLPGVNTAGQSGGPWEGW